MVLALAVLLIHPQLVATIRPSAERVSTDRPTAISVSASAIDTEFPLPLPAVSPEAVAEPAAEPSEALPEAPLPLAPAAPPAPIAFVRPNNPWKVSVAELRAENRRKQIMWKSLVVATSGAATFDAWSTRHAITTTGARELDPLLKPFAGNASLYAAVQVGPLIMDFVGKKMMYSRYSWARHTWWVPQSISFVGSMFCGAHNLAYQ